MQRRTGKRLETNMTDAIVCSCGLRHGYGIKALKDLPRKLREDFKLVLLAVKSSSEDCNETYETLSELSEEMVVDPDIVLQAVKR
jgi:DNA-binding NarL/FixJ family response regulator